MAGGERDGSNDREAAARLQEWARQDREREGYITARRTEERERLSVGGQAANHWGGLVLKSLVAVNSGALITGAALFTDTQRRFSDPEALQQSLAYLIAGVMVAILAAMFGYFNALAHQSQAHHRLNILALQTLPVDDEVKAEIASTEVEDTRVGWWIYGWLWSAVISTFLSATLFLIGVRLMFVAL